MFIHKHRQINNAIVEITEKRCNCVVCNRAYNNVKRVCWMNTVLATISYNKQ